MPQPDRPTHVVAKIPRYIGNKVVSHLLHMASTRGALTLEQIWGDYNLGMFTSSEMKEFYQLLGVPITAYKATFNSTFDALAQPELTTTKENDLDAEVEAAKPNSKKKRAAKPAKVEEEPPIADDPDRLAAASLRKRRSE